PPKKLFSSFFRRLLLVQLLPAKRFGCKRQRLFCVHTGQPQGIRRRKEQLSRRLLERFGRGVLPGRLALPPAQSQDQGLFGLGLVLRAKAAARRPLLQLLGPHQRRQGCGDTFQLVPQGPAAFFLILERVPAVYTAVLRRRRSKDPGVAKNQFFA